MDSSFDYIIVGGGTAGVVIASRLKKYLPDSRIALVEAGPNAVEHPKVNDVSDPTALIQLLQEGLVVDYSTTPQDHLDNREIMNPAGRLLSGSSGVNVGMWMRASTADHEVLAKKAGHQRFTFNNMLKYIKRLETHFDLEADKDYCGFDGLIHTVGGRKYPLREILQKSAEKLGHRYNPDAAKGDPIGLADFNQCFRATSASTVTRQHSAKVYDLSGVEVFCDTPVARIIFDESRRATGVELLSGEKLYASKEVIVCCGAQKTPQILMLSGIGPKVDLTKHDISTIVDAPSVGQNLFDHSILFQYYKLKEPSKGYSVPFEGTARPEYGQGLPIDFSLIANIEAANLMPHLEQDSLDTRSGDALHMLPLSRGTITLKSADPNDGPICNPRFLSTHTDRYILRRAVRENIKLVETEPFASEIEGEAPPADPKFPILTSQSSDEDIDSRIRAFAATVLHPMGTCALGTVLDDEFRVNGVKGLRVCDASVFPDPIAAMPSGTIYALAEMCAELVAGDA
ncbi:GMC oxidoreductase [Cucurbitaria berberidis CBS 394.84]|uniref:GMC oxidoreductase n=1 Tax=Cucurbitaria berberidis CBS 394.84 TaxID=1168544 RepID=A0A9P4L7P7_9PLEO|nr:GMC oxidoreductase [Cucurbitaria berberidis CBS 394.84]KAF1844328.1 GMC oxidoreductase [Cucurbitaria berberidis CBS 394.84]